MTDHVFISHSTRDDDVVSQIRTALEGLGVPTWVDSRRLTAGAQDDDEVPGLVDRLADRGLQSLAGGRIWRCRELWASAPRTSAFGEASWPSPTVLTPCCDAQQAASLGGS